MTTFHFADGDARAGELARQLIARADAAAVRGDSDEALDAYARAIDLCENDPSAAGARADALRGAGIVHQGLARWAEAERDFLASLEVARRLGDHARIGRSQNCLAAVAFERGDWRASERHYEAARLSAEAAGDMDLAAQIDNNEGSLFAARGEYERAEEIFERALERFVSLDQHPCAARVLNNLGLVLARQGRHLKATSVYDRALTECKRRCDAELASKVLMNQAELMLARGNPLQAHAGALKAWALARRLEDGPVAAGALCILGEVAIALEDRVGAIYYLRRALRLATNGKAPLVEAETWVQIGNLYLEQGQIKRAVDTWQFARSCYRKLGADAEWERLGDRIDAVLLEAASREDAAAALAPPWRHPTLLRTRLVPVA